MSDVIIKAEGLGKKYLIGHQSDRERYTALRDVLVRNTKSILNRTRQVLSGQQLLSGDEIEEFWALKDIDFEIKRGDRVGIIGHNGAGKSTLLKVLSRITEPSAGRVEIHGRVASLLEVGTGFHPELTGRENIFLNGAILGMARTEIKKKFDEIVDFAGVEKFLDTPVKRYSSGMYVRLAFAVAAHMEPEILVVDEVLAVGDMEFQKKCLGKMEDVSRNEGRTVLFVSHNMSALKSLTQNSILLVKGIAKAITSTESAINQYYDVNILNHDLVSINSFRRKERDPIATINKVEINGEESFFTRIKIGEPIEIQFFIASEINIDFSAINIIFRSTNGETISAISSYDNGKTIHLKRGLNIISLKIKDNIFLSGKYMATFGITSTGKNIAYDVIIDYPLFEIYGESNNGYWIDRPMGSIYITNVIWM